MPLESTAPPKHRWYHVTLSILLIVLCLEVGTFLLIFPWLEYWNYNRFGLVGPDWRRFWESSYFRGAISGLGVVNLYISLMEIFRLRRFGKNAWFTLRRKRW